MKRFVLPKKQHLCSKNAIETLFKEGKSFISYPLRVVYRIEPRSESSRPAVLSMIFASKRYFKHAVDRNRYKRLMREAYRLQQHQLLEHLEEQNMVMDISFNTVSAQMPSYDEVSRAMNKALRSIIRHTTPKSE